MKKGELFNVSGDKLSIIEKILNKDKKRLELEAAPPERIKYSYIRTQDDLQFKRKEYLDTRFFQSPMANVMKYAVLGDESRMRQELVLGFPVNSRDAASGRSILHEAVALKHISMVRIMCLEFRADPNLPTFMGLDTALHLGAISDCRQICVSLVLNGADPNARNRQGNTPLFFVRSKRILKVVLRAGADPLIKNKRGENALEFLRRPENLGHEGWEFGMLDILVKAVDSMKVRRYKEGIGEYDDDDGLSSVNSAARSRASLAGSQHSRTGSMVSMDRKKAKLLIENNAGVRTKSARS